MNARLCRLTMKDMAALTGLPLDTVRKHGRERRFVMNVPESVIEYVAGYRQLKSAAAAGRFVRGSESCDSGGTR